VLTSLIKYILNIPSMAVYDLDNLQEIWNGFDFSEAYGNVIAFKVPCPSCNVVNVVSRKDNRITNQYSEDL
jgi:hypothetical protein